MSNLDAIYACKLYKSSKFKSKIRSAIVDPMNRELVEQLTDYLDDSSKTILKKSIDSELSKHEQSKQHESADKDDTSSNDFDSLNHLREDKSADSDNVSDDTSDETSIEQVEEAKEVIPPDSITSSAVIDNNIVSEIKGLLNVQDSTCGVARVMYKDKEEELWIYYSDNINLNNVMGDVIEAINSANYSYLTFNRLARTDNAIVFQCCTPNSSNGVKPVSSLL